MDLPFSNLRLFSQALPREKGKSALDVCLFSHRAVSREMKCRWMFGCFPGLCPVKKFSPHWHGTQSGHTWADVAVTARPYTGLAGNVYPKERCPGLQHNVSLHLSRTKNNNDNVYWDCQVSLLLHLLRRVELLCCYIFYAESRIANLIEGRRGGRVHRE